MATTVDEAAVFRLFVFLNDFRTVAIRSRSTEEHSRDIVQVLLSRIHQFGLSHHVGPQLTFAESTLAIRAVVQSANISQLATDTQTPEDHVLRILGVIGEAPNADWGQMRFVNQLVLPGTNLHALFVPIPRSTTPREYVHWPESIPQHAFQLRRSFDSLFNARNPSQQTGYNISVRDFGILKDGVTLLDQKITTAFGNILDILPQSQRSPFAAQNWYINPYQRFLDAQRLSNAYIAPNMASNTGASMGVNMASNMGANIGVNMGFNMGANMRPNMAPNMATNMTSGMAFGANHNQPHSMNQVPSFAAQGNNAQRSTLSQPGPGRQPSVIRRAMPFAAPIVDPFRQNPISMQPVTSKHLLVHSPGKSPVKKKARDTPMSAIQQPAEELTRMDTPYSFFVLAERDNMMDDLTEEQSGLRGGVTGQELDNLIFRIWTMMNAEQKAPFEAACQKWQEQQREETQAPAANEDNPNVDLTQTKKRMELVQDIKRCRVVLNAATLCRTLRNQSLANNASRDLARPSTARPLNAPTYPILPPSTLHAGSSLGLAPRALPFMVRRESASQASAGALSRAEMPEQPQRNNASTTKTVARSGRRQNFFDRLLKKPPTPSLPSRAAKDAKKTGVRKGSNRDV